LRIAVIGVGHLGKHHARILSTLPGVELVAVVDTNIARAEEIARAHGTSPLGDARELAGKVDAVTIAVPTEVHRDIALPFLSAGISVLVEKPMARSLAEADAMIAASAKAGDIDVVFDLMIHDLDVVLSLVDSEVDSIDAVGVPVLTGRVDIANARVRFANGCLANLTASRISRDRVRKIRFFQPSAYLSIDYGAQKVEMFRLVTGGGMPSIQGGDIPVTNEEPLVRELADFVDAVTSKRAPLVTGEQGRRALALAQQITDKIAAEMQPRRHEATKP